MSRIAQEITDFIGNTPLIELIKYSHFNNLSAKIIAKLEYFNPAGSVKDRIAYAMIDDAQKKGLLKQGSVIIEATSGNTGIGLAMVTASKGYELILTMPDTMSVERRQLLAAFGANLVLTPGKEGMAGAVKKADELALKTPNSFRPRQFDNPANPEIHRKTTAIEILRDTDGEIDIFVSGVGTGGTITGVGEILKQKNKDIKIVAVEPADSPVLSGGNAGPHKIQGIGAGFVPSILNRKVIDEIITVKNEEAYKTMQILTNTEGILVGISSGAALFAATVLAKRQDNKGKNIVVILPDTGERYLSMNIFNHG